MPQLMTVEAWIEQTFAEGSRPPKRRVWRWIRDGRLPAERIGKRYYIAADAHVATTLPPADQLVQNVLQGYPGAYGPTKNQKPGPPA